MNDKRESADIAAVTGSIALTGVVGITFVIAIALAYHEGYKAGIRESPATVNVRGDQIITNTSSNLSPFSGNANKGGRAE